MTEPLVPSPPRPRVPHVELVEISRTFGGVHAVRGVTLQIEHGEVHALVGENGAGKSSLGKIIAGQLAANEGTLLVEGNPVTFGSPRDALANGIAIIAQELALVPGLTVAENVYLGVEPRTVGVVRRRMLRRRYDDLAKEVGFELPASAVTGTLRTADLQKVEIMRAISRGASMIIMDEPTAALSGDDTLKLHQVVRNLAASGHTVLLISHYLSEVLELADTVSIMRDGFLVRNGPAAAETETSLIAAMLGRTLGSVFPPKPDTPPDDLPPVITVTDLVAPGVRGVTLQIRPGEIVGLTGLVGAGRTELARTMLGAQRASGGQVRVGDTPLRLRGPADGMRAGVFLIPESRKEQGLIPQRSVVENITLASLRNYSAAGVVHRRRQRQGAVRLMQRAEVRAARPRMSVSALSGGNQQKTLFARAMGRAPRVLIADEPTRGVDVGSRRVIYDVIGEQARAGLAVLLISSDVEEVLGLAHRVLVMRGGAIVAELSGDQMSEHNVLTAAFAETGGAPRSDGGP